MATTVNITMYAGETVVRSIAVTQDSVAFNLTGATLRYVINTPTQIAKTIGAGITIVEAAGGTFTLTLASTDTAGLVGSFEHELKVKTSGGVVTVLMVGTVTISRSLILNVTPSA